MLRRVMQSVISESGTISTLGSAVLHEASWKFSVNCGACININARFLGGLSFFNRRTGEQLWGSATSVSNAGRKRGRARGRKLVKNLNKGQHIGIGKVNMVWPGLNAPVARGRELVKLQELPQDPTYEEKIFKIRDSFEKFRTIRIAPLERGWTGTKMPGRSIGPPDPVGDENFSGFDCKVLEMKQVANMTGLYGRVRRFSILVVTGNKKGCFGVALGKHTDAQVAMRIAKNTAIKRLRYVELFEGRTVFHDFVHQMDSTGLFVKRVPEGTGVVAHRAIRTICEVAGISDLYVKCEGRMNLQKTVKAFMAGLYNQETHQHLADRKRMHIVELRPENKNFPMVLASPKATSVRKDSTEVDPDENLRFDELYSEGKVKKVEMRHPPWFTQMKFWEKVEKKRLKQRGWQKQKVFHWMKKETEPSKFYDWFPAPDIGFPREPVNLPVKPLPKFCPPHLRRVGN